MECGKSSDVVWIRVRVSSTGQHAPPTQLIMNTVQPRLTATSLILVPSVQPPVTFLSEIPINPATLFIWPDFYAPMVAVVTGSHILFLRGPVCRSAGLFVVCLSVCPCVCLSPSLPCAQRSVWPNVTRRLCFELLCVLIRHTHLQSGPLSAGHDENMQGVGLLPALVCRVPKKGRLQWAHSIACRLYLKHSKEFFLNPLLNRRGKSGMRRRIKSAICFAITSRLTQLEPPPILLKIM